MTMTHQQQYVAFTTIVRKEITRFVRIWPQTILPPVITQTLYFLIFGKFIGSQITSINGIDYMSFIVPGLIMMSIINNSYGNVVSSFFSSKFQRSIEELLVSPTPNRVVVAGFITGGIARGLSVGFLVFIVSMFFARPRIHHIGVVILFTILTSLVFSLGGLINAIFAKKFDDVSIFPTFVLTPLTYLGGVFYSVQNLPEAWRNVSHFNPILYMVNGFRFGFYGFSDVPVVSSVFIMIGLIIVLTATNLYLLRKGTGIKT